MAGLFSVSRTTPVLFRRVAFHHPTTNGPNALRSAISALTSSSNVSSTIAALRPSTASAILSYCYTTSTKNKSIPASAFSAPVTPDCSNETAAAAARTYATKMSPEQQAQEDSTGLNDWKTKAPYRLHDPNEHFEARYEAACHCGKVEYEISREEPLDSKLCHCTTCQTQHGMFLMRIESTAVDEEEKMLTLSHSRTIPMGRHLPQRRHQLQARPPQPRVVRPDHQIHRAPAALQSPLFVLPQSDHGRGPQHDSAVPFFDQVQERSG
jgi:hypothetical protein